MEEKISIKHKKGVWKRYLKLIYSCKLPLIWIAAYFVVAFLGVNLAIDETGLTSKLFAGDTSVALVSKLVIVLVFNIIVSSLASTIKKLTEAKINRNARKVLTKQVLSLPMSYFSVSNPRDITSRLTVDIKAIGKSLVDGFLPLVSAIYGLVTILVTIGNYDFKLSIILVCFIPLSFILTLIKGRIIYYINKIDHHLLSLLTVELTELIENITLTKAFGKEEYEQERGSEIAEEIHEIGVKHSWYELIFESGQSLLDILQNFFIILLGATLVKNGSLSIEGWIAFFLFSMHFNHYLKEILEILSNIKALQGSCDYLATVMQAKIETNEGKLKTKLTGDIRFENVSFGLDNDPMLFNDVSFVIPEGKLTAIVGKSGTGKSMLVNLIQRLYKPTQGSIYFGNTNIEDYELESYRTQISYMAQDAMLFSGSLKENLLYGLNKEVSDEQIWEALRKTKAYDFVNLLTNKLDYQVQAYGSNFSSGEKQKIALTRVLLDNDDYLILDESTSNLDVVSVKEIIDIVSSLNKTIIIITHNEEIINKCDKKIVIENQNVKEVY